MGDDGVEFICPLSNPGDSLNISVLLDTYRLGLVFKHKEMMILLNPS